MLKSLINLIYYIIFIYIIIFNKFYQLYEYYSINNQLKDKFFKLEMVVNSKKTNSIPQRNIFIIYYSNNQTRAPN